MTRLAPTRLQRTAAAAATALALLSLQGCASGPQVNPKDPLETYNREVTQFNEKLDLLLLKPTATLYREKVPPLVRTGASNFFSNLGDGWSAVNSLLQFKLQNTAENWMRFSLNTVFGLGGLLDIASEANIDRHSEDFGQTLGRWGMPPGPYIVLPLLGPSTLRDTLALPVDWKGDPLHRLNPSGARESLYFLRVVDVRANLLRAGDVLEGAALDKYSFMRDAYLQKRRADIFEGGRRPADEFGGRLGPGPSAEDDANDGQIAEDPDTKPSR